MTSPSFIMIPLIRGTHVKENILKKMGGGDATYIVKGEPPPKMRQEFPLICTEAVGRMEVWYAGCRTSIWVSLGEGIPVAPSPLRGWRG